MRNFLYFFFLFFTFNVFAQPSSNVAYRALELGRSAREAALGGKATALFDDDANLAVFTPSLLNKNMDNSLNINYINYFSDIKMGYFAYVKAAKAKPIVWSGAVRFFDYGDFSANDEYFNNYGSFKAGEWSVQGGMAYMLDSNFTLGANLKFLHSSLASYNSSAIASDLSASYYNPANYFGATLLISNLGFALKNYTKDEPNRLPFDISIGLSKKLANSPLRFSVVADNLTTWDLSYSDPNIQQKTDPLTGQVQDDKGIGFGNKLFRHVYSGAELVFSKNFNVRLGYNYRRRQELKLNDRPGTAGISWGFSFRINRFQLSYARAKYHLASPSNHFTLSTNLHAFSKKGN